MRVAVPELLSSDDQIRSGSMGTCLHPVVVVGDQRVPLVVIDR